MATTYNGIDEKERERLRRLAQMRAGIEEKDDALDMKNKAEGKPDGGHSGGAEPPGEWDALSDQEKAIENGAFGTGNEEPVNTMPAGESTPGEAQMQTGMDTAQDGEDDEPEEEPPQTDEPEANEGGETPKKTEGTENTEEPETEKAKTESGYTYKGKTYGRGELEIEDPIDAAVVLYSGGREALSESSFERIKVWLEGSEGIKAMHGILSLEDMERFAVVDEDGNIIRELNHEKADYIRLSSFGKLGSTLGGLAMKLNDPSVPRMLYADAFGTLATVIENAEKEAEEKGVKADAVFFDQYCEEHKESREFVALAAAYGASEEMWTGDERLQQGLDTAIEEARNRCRNGEGTWRDYEMIALHYPTLTNAEKKKDQTYMSLLQAGEDAEKQSRKADGRENWFNEQAEQYLKANGLDTGIQGIDAYTYKGNLLSCWNEAVDMMMDYSTQMGYDDLATCMKEEGFTEETIQGLALMKFWEFEREFMTDENAEAVKTAAEASAETRNAGIFETIGRGLLAGGAGYIENLFSGIYTWAESMDLNVDAARVQNIYTSQYGFYDGQSELYDQLMGMCEEGYFPNDNMNENIKEYLLEGGNPYLLGIVPEEMGVVVDVANAAGDVKDVQDDWAGELGWFDRAMYEGSSKVGEYAVGNVLENTLLLNGLKLVFNDHGMIDLIHPFLTAADEFNSGHEGSSESAQGIHDVKKGVYQALFMIACSYEVGPISPEEPTREAFGMALQEINGMGAQKWIVHAAKENIKELPKNALEYVIDNEKGKLKDGIVNQHKGMNMPNDNNLDPAEKLRQSGQWIRMLGF